MASRSTRSRSTSSAESPLATAGEEEKVCQQIREHLKTVTSIGHPANPSIFSSQCGHAIYSKPKGCWKVHHVQHLPGSSEGKQTPVAELYWQGDKNRSNSPRSRPKPPIELVESLLMSQELKSWIEKSEETLEGTSNAEERRSKRIARMANLSFHVRCGGEVINFAVFTAMMTRKEECNGLLGRVLSHEGNSDLWRLKTWKNWVVEPHPAAKLEESDDSGKTGLVPPPKSSSPLRHVTSILERVGTLLPNNENEVGEASEPEPSPTTNRRLRRRLDDVASDSRVSMDSLSSLPPPVLHSSGIAQHAKVSSSSAGPVIGPVDNTSREGTASVDVKKLGSEVMSHTGRPPALESSSESEHTTDDETKEDHQNQNKNPTISPSPLIAATAEEGARMDEPVASDAAVTEETGCSVALVTVSPSSLPETEAPDGMEVAATVTEESGALPNDNGSNGRATSDSVATDAAASLPLQSSEDVSPVGRQETSNEAPQSYEKQEKDDNKGNAARAVPKAETGAQVEGLELSQHSPQRNEAISMAYEKVNTTAMPSKSPSLQPLPTSSQLEKAAPEKSQEAQVGEKAYRASKRLETIDKKTEKPKVPVAGEAGETNQEQAEKAEDLVVMDSLATIPFAKGDGIMTKASEPKSQQDQLSGTEPRQTTKLSMKSAHASKQERLSEDEPSQETKLRKRSASYSSAEEIDQRKAPLSTISDQATSLRRSKRRDRSEPEGVDTPTPPETKSPDRRSLRPRWKPRVTFAEENNDCFPAESPPQKRSPRRAIRLRDQRRSYAEHEEEGDPVHRPTPDEDAEGGGSSRRVTRSGRSRTPTEEGAARDRSRDPQTCVLRIKLKGERSMGPLEAVISSEGLPQDSNKSMPPPTNKYSFRKRKARSYSEDDNDLTLEEASDECGVYSDDSDDEGHIVFRTPPFILHRKNILRAETLIKNYEEGCFKRHGTCFSLNSGKDIDPICLVESLTKDLEVLDRKHPMPEEEEDEDFVAEQQLQNRTLRVMQGRRSQEKAMRMKEKEQAEQAANLLIQKQWTHKKRAPTMGELEWDGIMDRPMQFAEARTMRGKRISGRESCPCAPTATRRHQDEIQPPCRLCFDVTRAFENPNEPIPVKGMVPQFRPIDTDAPNFLLRDDDAVVADPEENLEASSAEAKASRLSKRMKFDPRRRRETSKKLTELRDSMDFIDIYNYGLLPKITTGS